MPTQLSHFEKFLPTQLLGPTRLLNFKISSHLHCYSDSTLIRHLRVQSKVRGRFRKILWPSQNMQTQSMLQRKNVKRKSLQIPRKFFFYLDNFFLWVSTLPFRCWKKKIGWLWCTSTWRACVFYEMECTLKVLINFCPV